MNTCTTPPRHELSAHHQTTLDRLYRANAKLVTRRIARLVPDRDKDAVEDMLSAAVLKLIETVITHGDAKFPATDRDFRAHLITIARCQLFNRYKAEQRQHTAWQKNGPRKDDDVIPQQGEDDERTREHAALKWLIQTGLNTLSSRQRDIIRRMYFLGATRSQIAAELGIAAKTVAAHRDTAIRRLRTALESARSNEHDLQHWQGVIRALQARKQQTEHTRRKAAA